MNDFVRNFIMTGLKDMIKRKVDLYQVYRQAMKYYEKEFILLEDLKEIQEMYPAEEEPEEVSQEETEVSLEETEVSLEETNEVESEE